MSEFKPGDVVILRSGGVPMTVQIPRHETYQKVVCAWHDRNGAYALGEYYPDMLIRYPADALAKLYRDIGL